MSVRFTGDSAGQTRGTQLSKSCSGSLLALCAKGRPGAGLLAATTNALGATVAAIAACPIVLGTAVAGCAAYAAKKIYGDRDRHS